MHSAYCPREQRADPRDTSSKCITRFSLGFKSDSVSTWTLIHFLRLSAPHSPWKGAHDLQESAFPAQSQQTFHMYLMRPASNPHFCKSWYKKWYHVQSATVTSGDNNHSLCADLNSRKFSLAILENVFMNIRYKTMTLKLPSWKFAHKIVIIHVCTFLLLITLCFFLKRLFLFSVCVRSACMHVYMCPTCVLSILGGEKWALDLLEWEFQMLVSQHNGCEDSKPGPLEEQIMLLTTDSSLQPLY